ncbi:MAG: ATP-binding protein [Rhodocyclaceae bacterium]|nr:ATP-binding protein [Rhodocyclaceae bacterium]
MNSLRRKITVGYSAIAILVVSLSLFSFFELRLMEERIVAGESIGEFFDTALEIRRFEKNYFLYHQATDLAENSSYVERGHVLLRDHAEPFETLAGQARIAQLANDLERYGALMAAYGRDDASEALATNIRRIGKDIITFAEELAGTERQALQAMLDRHRRLLLASVIAVGLLVIVIGQLLARRVGRPLKEMEASMEAVAAGRLTQLDMKAEDREIASLTQAFNHVLRELEVRQGQLVRSEKLAALGTLLSGVAHELNNPLSNIGTSCQILSEEVGSGGTAFQKELIEQIDAETWRARHIVRSLLDYARDREFKHEPIALARLVEDTLRLMRSQIPAQVAVTVDIPDALEVFGDRQRLQQVLINLVGNAAAAIAGNGTIAVSARQDMQACACGPMVFGQCASSGSVEIVVRDSGEGIPADVLPRIFDPFFTTKEVGHGVGLGLFIVFEIIEEHGGCIAVESATGGGTTFRIRLPVEKP